MAGALVAGGLSPLGAIQAATVNGAELLGWATDAGTIEPGRFADIVAVSGDPLADIGVMEGIVFVMKGGAVTRGASPPPDTTRGSRLTPLVQASQPPVHQRVQ